MSNVIEMIEKLKNINTYLKESEYSIKLNENSFFDYGKSIQSLLDRLEKEQRNFIDNYRVSANKEFNVLINLHNSYAEDFIKNGMTVDIPEDVKAELVYEKNKIDKEVLRQINEKKIIINGKRIIINENTSNITGRRSANDFYSKTAITYDESLQLLIEYNNKNIEYKQKHIEKYKTISSKIKNILEIGQQDNKNELIFIENKDKCINEMYNILDNTNKYGDLFKDYLSTNKTKEKGLERKSILLREINNKGFLNIFQSSLSKELNDNLLKYGLNPDNIAIIDDERTVFKDGEKFNSELIELKKLKKNIFNTINDLDVKIINMDRLINFCSQESKDDRLINNYIFKVSNNFKNISRRQTQSELKTSSNFVQLEKNIISLKDSFYNVRDYFKITNKLKNDIGSNIKNINDSIDGLLKKEFETISKKEEYNLIQEYLSTIEDIKKILPIQVDKILIDELKSHIKSYEEYIESPTKNKVMPEIKLSQSSIERFFEEKEKEGTYILSNIVKDISIRNVSFEENETNLKKQNIVQLD